MRVAFKAGWPLVLATVGALPIVAARVAFDDGNPAAGAAGSAAAGVVALFVLVCGWVRMRDRIAEWWSSQMKLANESRRPQADG